LVAFYFKSQVELSENRKLTFLPYVRNNKYIILRTFNGNFHGNVGVKQEILQLVNYMNK